MSARDVVITVLLPHLAAVIGGAFAVVIVARAAQQHRPTGSTIAWLLGIVLLPYVGVPLYLLFGGRKLVRVKSKLEVGRERRGAAAVRPLERMLVASGAAPATHDNRVELLSTGESAFTAVLRVIDEARRSIHLSTLIFAGDEVGEAISERLCARARDGLEVRVLIDGLFQFRSRRSQMQRLRRAGARVAWFMPVLAMPLRNHANLRLHRKAIIADGMVALVGGMNIAREYMGPTPRADRWRDLSALITGQAARDLNDVFASDWQFAAGETLTLAPPHLGADDGSVQIVGSGPDAVNDLLYDAFLQSTFDAKHRLWVATPYFVPDEVLTRAFVLAVRRGVDVRVVLPLRSNHRTADLAGASYLRDVAAGGGRVFCYGPGMLHAKAILVDDDVAILGSANLDMRSLFLNYELGVFLRSRQQVHEVAAWFEATFPLCTDLPRRGRMRSALEALARLLAPLE